MRSWVLLLMLLWLTACLASTPVESVVAVTIQVDGTTQTLTVSRDGTVNDALKQAGVVLGDLDRIEPPGHTRLSDGLVIEVVRISEELVVVEEIVPFQSRTTVSDGIPAGETRLLQTGANGVAEVTYRVTYANGVETSRSEIRRTLLKPPQDEILLVGSQSELPTVTVNGTLAYISDGNAWIIRQNSANRRPLTVEGGLDGRVFKLSPDGRRLLFSRSLTASESNGEGAFNQLWAILDTTDPAATPIALGLYNILFADWVPGTQRFIVYSTAEPRPGYPGWQANNDLWRASLRDDGTLISSELLVEPSSGGIYGWYGTTFAYAPDGVTLAWSQPDAVGILSPIYLPTPQTQQAIPESTAEPTDDFSLGSEPTPEVVLESLLPSGYARRTLGVFSPRNAYDFVWRPDVAWSPDGTVIVTTTHGLPLGSETPEDSPVFNVTALASDGGFAVDLVEQAGMWASPQFSPAFAPDGSPLTVRIAYLQAIEPLNSAVSRYRLVIMDRDGSNEQTIFPPEGWPGLSAQVFAWSPNGQQIALIHQGNLYVVDVISGLAQQITDNASSSSPRWVP